MTQHKQDVQNESPTKLQYQVTDTSTTYSKKKKSEDYIITPIQYKWWFHHS